VTDPYLDPDTGILRNRLGLRTQHELDVVEGDLAWAGMLELLEYPPPATGDLDELRAIHRELFRDVYDWAGEVRTVDMRKNVEGAEFFLPASMIGRSAGYAADELRADDMLRGMDRDRFVERLAHHYDQFNYVHPFREGNGRTQRVFWDRVSRDAGYTLDWREVSGRVNDEASRAASEARDLGPLQAMFDRIAAPLERDRNDRSARADRLAIRRHHGEERDAELGFDR